MKKEIPWELIISKLKNELTPGQSEQFDQWLAIEGNSEIYVQLEQLWNEVRSEASEYEPDVAEQWKKLAARLKFSESEKGSEQRKAQRVALKPSALWRRIAAAAAIVLIAGLGGYLISDNANSRKVPAMAYSTVSGKSKMLLPDGTEVWLHNETSLNYDAGFGRKQRNVSFEGEAYFEVAHNKRVPFIVKTDGISVKVYGTKFNLRNRPEEEKITVSLLEGSVAVQKGDSLTMLRPGEEAVVDKKTGTVSKAVADVAFAANWSGESLEFNGKSLEYITRYLSNWYDVKIDLDENGVKSDFAYTFTVKDETLEEIVRLISRISPIEYYFDEANTLHISVEPE